MSAAASLPLFPNFFSATLAETDPQIAEAIDNELGRQQHEIELIAAENIGRRAVVEAQGSILTNQYAEGYPGRRNYGRCPDAGLAGNVALERGRQQHEIELIATDNVVSRAVLEAQGSIMTN